MDLKVENNRTAGCNATRSPEAGWLTRVNNREHRNERTTGCRR